MELNELSPSQDIADAKTAFRKPSNDAANRKYRRHSSVGGSSSSDESAKRGHSSSPTSARDTTAKYNDDRQRRTDDRRDLSKDSGRNQHGRSSDSYGTSDRQSSRHDKHGIEDDRDYYRSSTRSGRVSRGGTRTDRIREEGDYGRSRDYIRDVDKYSREKYDSSGHRSRDKDREASYNERQKYKDMTCERSGSGRRHGYSSREQTERDRYRRDWDARDEKRDYHRSTGDHRSDRTRSHEESSGHWHDFSSRREDSGLRLKDAYKSDDREVCRDNERHRKESAEKSDDKTVTSSENQESPAKKQKFYCLGDEKQSSTTKQVEENSDKFSLGLTNTTSSGTDGDLDSAKFAAMRAAELVNKNLTGVGCMTTEQKKKLLWGNKKATTADEAGHRWDAALFSDRERQEKFNKLMGVKGDAKIEPNPATEDAEKQRDLQMDLEKQYTAGLRRRDGRTVGLGL